MDEEDFYNDDDFLDRDDRDPGHPDWFYPPLEEEIFDDEFTENESHQSSLVEQLYQQNLEQIKELESKDRNWVPDNIRLTTQDAPPIIYINSTKEKPEIYPIKLATITLNAVLPVNFNLKVLALYLPLDDKIIGVKCEQVSQRGWFKPKTVSKKKKRKKKGRKDKADFYNQCTINIRPYGFEGSELINMKIFPNGKMGFTGVKKVVDAEVALKYILAQISKLEGQVTYFLKKVEYGNSKNFRKKIKVRQPLLEYLSEISELDVNWDDFIENIQTKGKNPYPDGIPLPFGVSHALTLMEIILTYYDLPFLDQKGVTLESIHQDFQEVFKQPRFRNFIREIVKYFKNPDQASTPEETMILINYLAADKNKAIPLPVITSHLAENFNLNQTQIILKYYLETHDAISIDSIVDALNLAEYQPEIIDEIEQYLLEEENTWKESEINLIFEYFRDLQPDDKTEEAEAEPKEAETNNELTKDKDNNGLVKDEVESANKVESATNEIESAKDEVESATNEVESVKDEVESAKDEVESVKDEVELVKNEEEEEISQYNFDFGVRFNLNLPAWSTKNGLTRNGDKSLMDYYSSDFINISNINTTFNTNFVLNREKFHQILYNKYDQRNCSFEPNYGGIKLTYLSTIDCQKHIDPTDPDIEPEYNGCHCKGVSVLIFPNITLITGGRSFRQILQAYEFIKSVMIKEFERIIKIDKNCPNPLDKYPNIISSNKHVFMKRKFILDNPKNHFILKTLGLLDTFF